MTIGCRDNRLEARTGEAMEVDIVMQNDSPVAVNAMHTKLKQLAKWKERSHKSPKMDPRVHRIAWLRAWWCQPTGCRERTRAKRGLHRRRGARGCPATTGGRRGYSIHTFHPRERPSLHRHWQHGSQAIRQREAQDHGFQLFSQTFNCRARTAAGGDGTFRGWGGYGRNAAHGG